MKHRHTHLIREIKDLIEQFDDYALAFASEEIRREIYAVIGSIPAVRTFLGKLPLSSVMGIAPEGPPYSLDSRLVNSLSSPQHLDLHRKNYLEWVSSDEGKVATVICRIMVDILPPIKTNEDAVVRALDYRKKIYKRLVDKTLFDTDESLSVGDYNLLEVFNEIEKGLAPFGLKLRHLAHHKDSDSFLDQIEVIPQPYL